MQSENIESSQVSEEDPSVTNKQNKFGFVKKTAGESKTFSFVKKGDQEEDEGNVEKDNSAIEEKPKKFGFVKKTDVSVDEGNKGNKLSFIKKADGSLDESMSKEKKFDFVKNNDTSQIIETNNNREETDKPAVSEVSTKKFAFVKKTEKAPEVAKTAAPEENQEVEEVLDFSKEFFNDEGLKFNSNNTAKKAFNFVKKAERKESDIVLNQIDDVTSNIDEVSVSNMDSYIKENTEILVNFDNQPKIKTFIVSDEEEYPRKSSTINSKAKSEINLDSILHQIALKSNSIRNLEKVVVSKENEIVKKEQEIVNAIESENYSLAAQLKNETKLIRNKIKEDKDKLPKLNKEMVELREQEITGFLLKIKNLVNEKEEMISTKEKTERKLKKFKETDLAKNKKEKVVIAKLVEKLEYMQKEIETDKTAIEDQEEQIDKTIKSQSVEVYSRLEELFVNRSSKELEIEEILKILADKQEELSVINTEINEKESEIEAIKSNYEPEFKKLNKKKNKYKEEVDNFNEQNSKLELLSANYEIEKKRVDVELSNLEEQLKKYEKEIESFEDKKGSLDKNYKQRVELLEEHTALSSSIYLVRNNKEQLKTKVQSKLTEIEDIEGVINTLESEISSINVKLPILESRKKTYITKEDYKVVM